MCSAYGTLLGRGVGAKCFYIDTYVLVLAGIQKERKKGKKEPLEAQRGVCNVLI